VYGISVAAELTGVSPQALRGYEARGLLDPARTGGGTRRYSGHDIDRINRITGLLEDGLNLAGVAHVLELESEISHLRRKLGRPQAPGRGR
jgi:DNA-binding transcriptional MerR regulator